jgi:cyclopropane-fatty-acyl-phospholipid synthase
LLVGGVMAALGRPPVTIALWDSKVAWRPAAHSVGTCRFRDRRSLWRFIARPEVGFARAWEDGGVEVDGDLATLIAAVFRPPHTPLGWATLPGRRLLPSGRNGRRRAGHNARHHYDVGNAFYREWLDENMVYTCAYFEHENVDLERAQLAKHELVCRKLGLRPGQRILELGSGWGAFALYAAQHYGVHVRAFNVSREQVSYAREQARLRGLSDRVEFVQEDYRGAHGVYDAVVSIGMLEHVGKSHFGDLRRLIDKALSPDGRGLLHFIGRAKPEPLNAWLAREMFPGGYAPSLREMLDVLEPSDMAVLDVENLRGHYALTLGHWLERFEARMEQIERAVGRRTMRAFRLYLAGTKAAFEVGTFQLFQVTFARAANTAVPMTRAALYREPLGEQAAQAYASTG